MSSFHQDFDEFDFPRFLQGPYLRTALTILPYSAEKDVLIMVPYLIQSQILDSILGLPDHLSIKLYTRSSKGYLPNIKAGAQPAIDKLRKKINLQIYIDNRIHAKIWMIDEKFAIVHSMNGTISSETTNFEAGIVSIDKKLIKEILNYFQYVEQEASPIQ